MHPAVPTPRHIVGHEASLCASVTAIAHPPAPVIDRMRRRNACPLSVCRHSAPSQRIMMPPSPPRYASFGPRTQSPSWKTPCRNDGTCDWNQCRSPVMGKLVHCVPSKCTNTLSPTAHTSLAPLPATRASARLVGLVIGDHDVPLYRRMRPPDPTANM